MRGLAVPSATIQSVVPETPTASTVRLQATLDYNAGQSIAIVFPGDPKKRYFSLSSSPTEFGHIAVTIKSPPGSPMASTVSTLKPGTSVEFEGPLGSFGLPDPIPGTVCFLAAGSGVTPFRSMIKYLLDRKPSTQAWLFHSVPSANELIFKDEMTTWANDSKSFHYIPTVTRETDESWTLTTGRIGEELLKKHLLLTDEVFYICGPKPFVADMELLLRESLNVPTSQIRREQW